MKIESPSEFVVDVHPISQSSGHVLDGGDCGYCCVAGLFNLPSIISAYEFVEKRMKSGWERRQSMCAWRWEFLLESLGLPNKDKRVPFRYYKTGVVPNPWDNLNWPRMIKRKIKRGNILIASIRFKGSPPAPPRTCGDSDHNVIINGWKFDWVPHPTLPGAKTGTIYIRVSCSVRGTYWIEWSDLVYWHGACPLFVINVDAARKAAV
ncbi:hypothetical protein CCP1ISM_20017 [Azospirillaceae bacterium]